MKFWDFLVQDMQHFDISSGTAQRTTPKRASQDFFNTLKKPDKSVALLQPQCFEDIISFVNFVSGNRSAVVDFNNLNNADTLRCIDFVSGAVCALHGKMESICAGVYLFVPNCTKLMTQKRKKRTNEK